MLEPLLLPPSCLNPHHVWSKHIFDVGLSVQIAKFDGKHAFSLLLHGLVDTNSNRNPSTAADFKELQFNWTILSSHTAAITTAVCLTHAARYGPRLKNGHLWFNLVTLTICPKSLIKGPKTRCDEWVHLCYFCELIDGRSRTNIWLQDFRVQKRLAWKGIRWPCV